MKSVIKIELDSPASFFVSLCVCVYVLVSRGSNFGVRVRMVEGWGGIYQHHSHNVHVCRLYVSPACRHRCFYPGHQGSSLSFMGSNMVSASLNSRHESHSGKDEATLYTRLDHAPIISKVGGAGRVGNIEVAKMVPIKGLSAEETHFHRRPLVGRGGNYVSSALLCMWDNIHGPKILNIWSRDEKSNLTPRSKPTAELTHIEQ